MHQSLLLETIASRGKLEMPKAWLSRKNNEGYVNRNSLHWPPLHTLRHGTTSNGCTWLCMAPSWIRMDPEAAWQTVQKSWFCEVRSILRMPDRKNKCSVWQHSRQESSAVHLWNIGRQSLRAGQDSSTFEMRVRLYACLA